MFDEAEEEEKEEQEEEEEVDGQGSTLTAPENKLKNISRLTGM